jgi:hypothetical protein
MNKKELIEELEKEPLDNAEIRITYPPYQLPPEVGHDIDRIYNRILDYDKLLEELMRSWMGVTYNILSTEIENIREAVNDLRDTIKLATEDTNKEVVADTVELTNRRDESGAHYHAIIIGE